MDFSRYDWMERWTYRCERVLSRFPDAIVVNSQAGMRYHGLESKRNVVVIPNGIDTTSFSPDPAAGRDVRKAWGVGEKEYLVGLVGRLDPMKDHPTFLKAASSMIRGHGKMKFVCVGDGPEPYKLELKDLARNLGLETSLIWAGERRDMPAVYNALDLATLSSYGEGFPNVVGEAMACGVPCVVTDVGDCTEIVGDTGCVVPPKDPMALAQGWEKLFSLPPEGRMELGEKARQRVIERFSLKKMVRRHEELFEEIMGNG
jgi:glycosyltransferase involved in cell wall biosynthesis